MNRFWVNFDAKTITSLPHCEERSKSASLPALPADRCVVDVGETVWVGADIVALVASVFGIKKEVRVLLLQGAPSFSRFDRIRDGPPWQPH